MPLKRSEMAKKSKVQTPDEIAYQDLLQKAELMMKATDSRERSRKVLQAGKELAMFLTYLRQLKIGNTTDEELPKMWLAQMLKEHPKELKKALAYYDALQSLDVLHNFEGFSINGTCLEKGRLWVSFNWFHLDLPKKEEGASEESKEAPGEGEK